MATSYKIRGIEPPDLATQPKDIKTMFWQWVVEFGLRVKDRELAQGLDRDGNPLRAISARTRKYRRSAMTPSGKGDPSAPPLMPARALSRTRSLLAGRALSTHAEFYWRFDAFTGQSWGEVLKIHARKGRNVIGLSDQGVARVRNLAWERWSQWKRGKYVPQPARPRSVPVVPMVGTSDVRRATFGIGASGPGGPQSTGGMTWPEWRKYLRQPAKVEIPGRPKQPYNRLLAYVWGEPAKPPGAPPRAPRPKPQAPPKPTVQRAAMAPQPMSLERFAAGVQAAAQSVPLEMRWAENKVWIIDAYERFSGGLGYTEWKRRLVEANQQRLVTLARSDLPQRLTPAARAKQDASEVSQGPAVFHWIRV